MHPPLAVHRHRQCEEIIEQLNACHRERTVAKFFGGCNDLKEALDKCFHEEYLVKRAENAEKARKRRQQYLDAVKEISG